MVFSIDPDVSYTMLITLNYNIVIHNGAKDNQPALATTRLVGKNDIDVSYENNSCSGQTPLTVMTGVE